MKELRFDAADGVWRVAFAFDPNRKSILLVAGDKSGVSEKRFYRQLIDKADARFDAHLAKVKRQKEREKEVTTMTNLERIRKELGPARRKKVEARAAQLIAEEMTLQELRRARKLTQVRMAKALGIGQDGISKLEKRSDLLLSTLRKTVEAMGGSLSLVAEFPDRDPVVLSGITEVEADPKPAGRKHAHAPA
jgi:DNA-binding XRE family transcriptional regulator